MNLIYYYREILCIFVLVCLVLCGCSTTKVKTYVPIDYSEETSITNEIKEIKLIEDSKSVKALWRSFLLVKNTDNNVDCLSLLSECVDRLTEEYNEALETKDYFKALRIYSSLKVCDAGYVKGFSKTDDELKKLIEERVTAYTSEKSVPKKISDCISGTVTILVDKGIKVTNGRGVYDMTLGSGFFISKDGYLITNYHVIADCVDPSYEGYARLYVKLAGDSDNKIPSKVIGYDSTLDLALLKVEVEAPYVFTLGSSLDLDVGDKVYAIGSPLGLERTLTSGIISAKERELLSIGKVFQIDAAVNGGNSGGPLIDEKGRVQAIVFAGMVNYEGLNFAIPVEYLKTILPLLYDGGSRDQSWIGCYGKTKKTSGYVSKNDGVTVNYVMPGGNANLSGIQKGDVIVGVNNISVSSLDDLDNFFIQIRPESILEFDIITGDGTRTKKIVYADKKVKNPGYEIYRRDLLAHSLYPLLGMDMVSTSQNRKEYMITEVIKGSVADDSGFSEGDPVVVSGIDFSDDKSYAYIRLSVKKKKSAYFDYTMGLQVSTDGPYYF